MHHPPERRRAHRADLYPFPGIVGRCLVCRRVFKSGIFIRKPPGAAFCFQLVRQHRIHRGKMDDIIKRIADLPVAEGAARPVCKA
ncbi:MAG: Uncharacterised protein [SAR116 cluster bacterium]|nr:MAG: Uncharacterised protein [SAR116 cluster bacterium]